KAGIEPQRHDLTALRSVGSTGAPLPPEGFEWVYEHVKSDLLLGSVSGGTDVCTAFALSCPLLPVRAGSLQCAGLGCKVEAFDPEGRPLVGEVGELVLTEPLPSMPLYFWGDEDGARYHESYFDTFEGVWRHGDWVEIASDGSLVISGRSDSTLNRGGVRMGTSEFYAVVEGIEGVADSLVVDTSSPREPEGKLWLFVVPAVGGTLDDELRRALVDASRSRISPRHVPCGLRARRAADPQREKVRGARQAYPRGRGPGAGRESRHPRGSCRHRRIRRSGARAGSGPGGHLRHLRASKGGRTRPSGFGRSAQSVG